MRLALLALLCACPLFARAPPADLAIEAELLPARVYVGAEATLRLRLLRGPGEPARTLRPPAPGEAAEVLPLGSAYEYETQRAGITYHVLERKFLIVPRRAGRLVVPGATLESPAAGSTRAPGPVRGTQLVLEVRPPPPGAGNPWLPARHLSLEESWSRDPDSLAAGVPVTRTLVLRAEGLAAERLPRLEMPAHPMLQAYHDEPELFTEYSGAGVVGRRVQRIVLMPLDEGQAELPAIGVRWWNVDADAPRVAGVGARTLRLGAAPARADTPPEPGAASPRFVIWALPFALMLLVLAPLRWYLSTLELREIRTRLRDACRRNDAGRARDALIGWHKLIAPDEPAPLIQRIGANWDARARAQLGELDAALYARREWDGKLFWRQVRRELRRRTSSRASSASAQLPRLFRLQERD